jgi:antitoxin component HigA of HigAB toxin-antitoxin module
MSDVTAFPIDHTTKGITGRDGYIVAEALYLATRYIDHMPEKVRLEADRHAMLQILNTAFPEWEDTFGPP